MRIKASSALDMAWVDLPNLHIRSRRPRSKWLGETEVQRGSAYVSTALGQAQEYAARPSIRSRSACGRPLRVSSEEQHEDIMEETSLPVFEQVGEGDDGNENNWSPATSNDSTVDQDTTLWFITTEAWSPSTPETPASPYTTPPIPLPAPNTPTSTYLPFSFHLALTNHLNSSTLTIFKHIQTPIFIHGMLQLPCTLSALLSLPTSDILCRLTPAILLNHTTYLDASTLLPSLVKSTYQSTYHHVNGLLYFPKTSACVDKIHNFFSAQTPRVEMKEATAQIQDSNDRRHDIVAWAWIAENAEGAEEWWTCEDFVAGRVVGLQGVEW